MYKALITDLDGTAVPVAGTANDINQATSDAVADAQKAGKKIACATGRDWDLTKDIISKLGFSDPCVIEGGTRIVEPKSGDTLWEKPLDHGTPNQLLAVFKQYTAEGVIMHSADKVNPSLRDVTELPDNLRYLFLIAIPETAAIQISNHLNGHYPAVAHFTPSWEGNGLVDIHVTHPQATKEHAITVWQGLVGVTKAETIGMGDSGNDVPIFEAVGHKVAVGNAISELKAIADYIAPPVTDNALEYVIHDLLLT